ncbi:MAG: hypothetical protein IKY94_13075 [Lachnospiraceae bacterium]|nr:hypothetical protein [Lachnospiraceae bacterium]
MDDFFQIIAQNDGIIATIITGIFTFFITKYTYHKNAPLDKLEISYDRIYYPIYRLIRSNKNVLEIVEKSELYLLKYNKYADRSTIKSFEFLKENMTDKDAYNAYTSNIFEMNRNLRQRLGYLEPNVLLMYSSSSFAERLGMRTLYEILFIYVFVMLYATTKNEVLKNIFLILSIISMIIFGVDIIVSGCWILWKKLARKIGSKQRKNNC